jgi:hypothetical protein
MLARLCSALAILALASSAASRAAEIDSLTGRERTLADSTKPLEHRLNDALETGVIRANQRSEGCDEEVLYRQLRRALASPFVGHLIAASLDEDEALDRRRIRRVESIYRDLGLLDNISVHWKDLSSVIRVGDVLIGVDKIGHFFVEGWDYFDTAYREGEGVAEAMAWGEGTEQTYFGRYTTGVHSYADLVANFEGMRFWRRVRGHAVDPLDQGWIRNRPYVTCGRRFWIFGERRWRLSRKLDLDDYVTPVWDEAVNCDSYRNEKIETLVKRRIAELSEAAHMDLSCPIDPRGCAQARQRYGAFAPGLLHPACLAARPAERRWWQLWR